MKHLAILLLVLVCLAGPGGQRGGTRFTAEAESGTADSNGVDLATTPAPVPLVSVGNTTVPLYADYKAGRIWRWLFGDFYRDVWATPLEVPIIDLEKTAGGLTPLERGGGKQTAALHLIGGDGRLYDLRSVNKDLTDSTPEKYRGTLVGYIAQDQISSFNPVASIVLTPLARAAAILHLEPVIVMIPDSPRLGIFREQFGGMVAYFERDPDEDQSDAARFGYSRNLVGTEKLLEELREDSADRVDERAFVRARLFDMLIGDWDRHERQWRWAEFETPHGKRFVPVPTDRDAAFVKFDGFLNRLARRFGDIWYRRLVDFGDHVPDVYALNWHGMPLDRRIAVSLTRTGWMEIADSLKLALTDDVIDRAVRAWPEPIFAQIGPMTARSLKSRRDSLTSVAARYYEMLADTVEILGSDADERFEISRLGTDEMRVTVLKSVPSGGAMRELYSRVFRRDETDEIRLSGVGGSDRIIQYGSADGYPSVRVQGGYGITMVIDSSAFSGPARLGRSP